MNNVTLIEGSKKGFGQEKERNNKEVVQRDGGE